MFCRLEEVTQFLPDPSLPPSEQLSQALDAIREQSKTMADLQGHVKVTFLLRTVNI